MAQYFTERLQKVFHMIFTSYNQKMAQEGLRQLELIVNNQQGAVQTDHRALRNDMTALLESDIDTKDDALKIANDSAARELGDAYALLARVYAGPRFTWEESNFPEDNIARISAYTIAFAVVALSAHYKLCASKAPSRLPWRRICKFPSTMPFALFMTMQTEVMPIANML